MQSLDPLKGISGSAPDSRIVLDSRGQTSCNDTLIIIIDFQPIIKNKVKSQEY